jgi:glycosyltransferase involved in cell wall biosynthesis
VEAVKQMDQAARAGAASRQAPQLAARAAEGRGRVVMFTADRQLDRRTLLEADSLGAAGWQVTILAVPASDRVTDDPRVVRLGAAGAAAAAREQRVLGWYRHLRRHLPMGGTAMRAVKAFAWRYVLSQEDFHRRLFAPALAAYPAQVFVAQDLPMLPVACEAARLHGGKVVYDSHELYAEQEFSAHEKKTWRALEERLIRRCDAVVTINEGIAQELERRYGVGPVHVVRNAAHPRTGAASPRRFHERLGLPASAQVLLMQGGLSAGRHLEVLVAAMARVRHADVHLVLLGDGVLGEALRRQVARSGLAARVHLLPAVAQRELLDWTAAADAGVIPYQPHCLNNYYCTPNKLFEFIAAGVPVLASDLPEIRRIVAGHGIGQLAGLGDAQQMAQAIDAFFADAQRLQGWRDAARRARETVNWDAEGARFAAVVEGLR